MKDQKQSGKLVCRFCLTDHEGRLKPTDADATWMAAWEVRQTEEDTTLQDLRNMLKGVLAEDTTAPYFTATEMRALNGIMKNALDNARENASMVGAMTSEGGSFHRLTQQALGVVESLAGTVEAAQTGAPLFRAPF